MDHGGHSYFYTRRRHSFRHRFDPVVRPVPPFEISLASALVVFPQYANMNA